MVVQYGLLLKKSWNDLKKNYMLFLPLLFGFLCVPFFGVMLLLEAGLFFMLRLNFAEKIVGAIGFIFIFGMIDMFVLVWLKALLDALELGGLSALMSRKKVEWKDLVSGGRNFTFVLVRVMLVKAGFVVLPLLVGALLVGGAFMMNRIVGFIVGGMLAFVMLIYLVGLGLFFSIGLLFLEPVISLKKVRSVFEVMKIAFKVAKTELEHTLLTWGIIIGVNSVLGVFLQMFSPVAGVLWFVLLPFIFLIVLASFLMNVYLKVFLFNAYFFKKIKRL